MPVIQRSCLLCAALAAACGGGGVATLEPGSDSLAFDPTPVGRLSPPRIVEWANAGADTVGIVELRLAGDAREDFLLEDDSCGGAALPPGRSCRAVVLFGPREPGPRTASIAPVTGSGASPPTALRGEGQAEGATSIETAGLVRAVPETLHFGEHSLGSEGGPLGVRLVNQRSGAVQFAARLRGGPAGEFRVALDRCSNEILAAGRACTIRILFAPSAEGTRSAELVLRDLNGTTSQTVPLAGTGIAAPEESPNAGAGAPMSVPLVVRPRALEFGVQPVGSTGASRVIQVENNNPTNVVLSVLRLSGDAAGAFRIVGGNCERRTLVPTRSCTIEVVYQPADPGSHTARIEAVTSAGVEPALVLLSGTGEPR